MDHSSSLPPLDALQAVLTASSTGSFSAAAMALNITHGAVSRRVAMVERWAGIRLFQRHGRGVRLTLHGERLVAQIELALAHLHDSRHLRTRGADLDTVRVGVVPSFARLWLLPRLAALEGTPSDLRIEPDVDQRYMTLSDARIAIRFGRGDWPGTTAAPLFDENLVPVACESIASKIATARVPGRVLDYPLIHDASDAYWRLWLSANDIEYERRPQDRVFHDYDLSLQAAAHGLGIALLRDPFGRAFCDRLGLRPIAGRSIPGPLRFHVVTKSGARHATVDRLVVRFLALAREGPA